jgi:hypothetical protein
LHVRRALRVEPLEARMVLSTVHAAFMDLTPAGGVFPTNVFTDADSSNLTGLRVNLPDPGTGPADSQDVQIINTLDGFNLQPRLSIPFDGAIDVHTVTSDTVFLIRLGDAADCHGRGGQIVGINQVVWDPATNTLHVESDELLDQHTRYALIVTNGVLDTEGQRIQPSKEFASFRHDLNYGQTKDRALKAYRKDIIEAMAVAAQAGVPRNSIVTASVFTTQSTTAVLEKIRDQIHNATPAAASFNVGLNGERAVFNLNQVTSIELSQQTMVGGPATPASPQPPTLGSLRTIPNVVSQIAYGKYLSPDYEVPGEGYIPTIGTRTGTPVIQAYNDIYFSLYLPAGERPEGGWPVAIVGHGSTGNKDGAFGASILAAKMAESGIATIGINFVGHGLGPGSTLKLTQTGGDSVTLPAGGRGIDQNGDNVIGNTEGFAAASSAILSTRDGRIQTVADLMQLVRVIDVGMDVDGNGTRDIDPDRVYYVGVSLGGFIGAEFLAIEPNVTVGVLNNLGGPQIEIDRLRPGSRTQLGSELAARVPSIVTESGIARIDGLPVTATRFFNENMPLWDDNPFLADENDDPLIVRLVGEATDVVIQSPVGNAVEGAMAIQQVFENYEWVSQPGNPVAYAPYLRKDPLSGVPAKSVLVEFSKGDQNVENPTTSAFLRAGDLSEVTTFYRHDLVVAANPTLPTTLWNPHTFVGQITNPIMRPIALAAQAQTAAFFASDGAQIMQPPGVPAAYFEVGLVESELPEGLNYIVAIPTLTPLSAAADNVSSNELSNLQWLAQGATAVPLADPVCQLVTAPSDNVVPRAPAEQVARSLVGGDTYEVALDRAQRPSMRPRPYTGFRLRDAEVVDYVFADNEWSLSAPFSDRLGL